LDGARDVANETSLTKLRQPVTKREREAACRNIVNDGRKGIGRWRV